MVGQKYHHTQKSILFVYILLHFTAPVFKKNLTLNLKKEYTKVFNTKIQIMGGPTWICLIYKLWEAPTVLDLLNKSSNIMHLKE